eukprot:909186-Lingulodinium_polyedra.AAC.1
MPRKDVVESSLRRRNGSQTARSRAPRADRKPPRAWSAQTCDFRAAAAAKRRFDRLIAARSNRRFA